MKKDYRQFRNISDLFNPNNNGITTYDLTYVTSRNNEQIAKGLKTKNNKIKNNRFQLTKPTNSDSFTM